MVKNEPLYLIPLTIIEANGQLCMAYPLPTGTASLDSCGIPNAGLDCWNFRRAQQDVRG